MENTFNNLTSKEWLPFQKSWFIEESKKETYRYYLRFFMKFDIPCPPNILFWGSDNDKETIKEVCSDLGANLYLKDSQKRPDDEFQYVLVDLRNIIFDNWDKYQLQKNELIDFLDKIYSKIKHRRFLSIFIPNVIQNDRYEPFAWDMAKTVSTGLTLKDEKIGCYNQDTNDTNNEFPFAANIFYTLQFRNDENCGGTFSLPECNYSEQIKLSNNNFKKRNLSSWGIIKPKPRSKKEILHPAKFPEEFIERFINIFSEKGDNIFDPMSGTGSTQIAAMQLERNGYGTELSPFFSKIANERCNEFLDPTQKKLFHEKKDAEYKILNKDARKINKDDFPEIDYIITSPPYWDMLNMKGAENQAKRKEKGLKLSYSESDQDLGNINEYDLFLEDLMNIYWNVLELLKPGGVITIIVKNIKKKGTNYPFAYDLANHFQKEYKLLPEFFWLQDDISIAPYGYSNTFVTNTFHQYCLSFQKPI